MALVLFAFLFNSSATCLPILLNYFDYFIGVFSGWSTWERCVYNIGISRTKSKKASFSCCFWWSTLTVNRTNILSLFSSLSKWYCIMPNFLSYFNSFSHTLSKIRRFSIDDRRKIGIFSSQSIEISPKRRRSQSVLERNNFLLNQQISLFVVKGNQKVTFPTLSISRSELLNCKWKI